MTQGPVQDAFECVYRRGQRRRPGRVATALPGLRWRGCRRSAGPSWLSIWGRCGRPLRAHPTFGPVLLARDMQTALVLLHDLFSHVQAIGSQLEKLQAEPDIKALTQPHTGTHVFLSYSRKNALIARQVRLALQDAGHTVWQDISSIKGGEQWLDAIDNGITRAYAMVLLLSKESWQSYWVKEEFTHAQRHSKHIIPVNIDGRKIPFGMKSTQSDSRVSRHGHRHYQSDYRHARPNHRSTRYC